ncbi:MAG: hypothetical protein J6W06_07720 [Bacteroidales bacterium]|nr:hypothetical protein [Bacteroidales bacterium]
MGNEQDKWHWQESNSAWRGIGIYHITLMVPSREPLLGTLIIPENNPAHAIVERTILGNNLVEELLHIPQFYPEIRILQFCLMPDHLHAVIYVTKQMEKSIRMVVRGFWQGAKKLGRKYSSSISPELNSGITDEENVQTKNSNTYPFPVFTEMPFIRPLSRRGQLQAMIRYIQMNPQRLATKRLKPNFFRVQHDVEINGRKYNAVGNITILMDGNRKTVHVRRTMLDTAMQGDEKPLHDYMNSCIIAAREGAVMVSPFISASEKEILAILLKEKLPIIYLTNNGLGEYYKPSDLLFDAVATGKLLILSPWPYNENKKHITREECVMLNNFAEEIASPESLQ